MPSNLRAIIRNRVGHEEGVVRKDPGGRLRVCLVYPNTYQVGMSSLGFQTVYHLFNSLPEVVCERAFLPDERELAILTRTGEPLISYESQTPLADFDVLALSISWELDFLAVPRVLRLARVPTFVSERDRRHPLVIAGGAAVTINPRPLADLVDLFVLGEGEEAVPEVVSAMVGRTREDAVAAAGKVKGVVVSDELNGPPDAQTRRYVSQLDRWPTHSRLLSPEAEFADLFLVEVSRGCGRGCKFCVTPVCYWPLRWRSAGKVLESARLGVGRREAVGLVGAAVSDHPEIDDIARAVIELGMRLSVSSLRADSLSPALLEALARSGARTITLAPEAGTERLRAAIGKPLPEDQLLDALSRAAAAGLPEARLYFMVGLPGETEEDVQAIPALVQRCLRECGLRRITVSAGPFVPKPGTPFAEQAMLPVRELSRRLQYLRAALRRERRVRITAESPNWAHLQWKLSHGDRRLGAALAEADLAGGNLAAVRRALAER